MSWCRLEASFRTSDKFPALAELLKVHVTSAKGLVANLWSWCLENRPDGELTGKSSSAVAYACEWGGDPDLLFDSLVRVGLLDDVDGRVSIHGWLRRAESYKRASAAASRREKLRTNDVKVTDTSVTITDASVKVPLRGEERRGDIYEVTKVTSVTFDELVDHYRRYHPKAKPGDKELRKFKARMKEGYTLDDLKKAVDGCHMSPHHCGQNDTGTLYQKLELILRDSSRVQSFIEVAEAGGPQGPGKIKMNKTRRLLMKAKALREEEENEEIRSNSARGGDNGLLPDGLRGERRNLG